MSAKSLCPYFVKENIISPDDHQEILDITSHIKAAGLLLCKISSAVKAEINEIFYKFLDITEQNGSIESKTITTAIRNKLLQLKLKPQSKLFLAIYVTTVAIASS